MVLLCISIVSIVGILSTNEYLMRWDVEGHGFFDDNTGIVIFQASWSQANPVRTQSTVTTVRSKKNHVLTLLVLGNQSLWLLVVTFISNWATSFSLEENTCLSFHFDIYHLHCSKSWKTVQVTSARCDSMWFPLCLPEKTQFLMVQSKTYKEEHKCRTWKRQVPQIQIKHLRNK